MPLYRAELLAKKPLRYAALIHDVSQVLHLPFDWDDGSYARDRSGYNNSGTIYGATLVTGKIGMARRFDGVDDYVEVPHDPSLNPTSAITVSVWAKIDDLPDTHANMPRKESQYVMHPTKLSATTYGVRFYVYIAGVGWRSAVSKSKNFGSWYFFAGTYDGAVIKIFADGVLEGSFSVSGKINTTANQLQFSRDGTLNTYRFKGIIDEPRIYNRALSQDEIRMLMYRRLV